MNYKKPALKTRKFTLYSYIVQIAECRIAEYNKSGFAGLILDMAIRFQVLNLKPINIVKKST